MSSSQLSGVRPRILAVSIATALGASASFVAPAHAQDEPALEEIVVTGSRIVRRDYQSNSPIVTVDNDEFETQTGLNIESYLNQMPQYNPAASPVTTEQDVQITPVDSVGIASISLRGFGPNRSLVLVDGKRMVPINALMVTDVNAIPSALIERVETITGGASAVYGADAVGGVTNFILRDDFEGFEVDMQHGATAEGDGQESRFSAVFGTNFGDGQGNIALGVESYNRDPAREINHDFYRERWADPDVGGGLFLQGVNGYNCYTLEEVAPDTAIPNCPAAGTVDALFSERPEGTNVFLPFLYGTQFGSQFSFNPDGSVFVSGSAGGLSRYDTSQIDGQEYARTRALDGSTSDPTDTYEGVKWNNQRAFISAPQERHSFFASGTYDLSDQFSLFARSTFAESRTRTLLFGTNAIAGWEATVPYDPTTDSPVDPTLDYTDATVVQNVRDNPEAYPNPDFIPTGEAGAQWPVPPELAILLNSRPVQDGEWQPDWNPDDSLPPRSTYNTNTVWQVEFGANFDLGADWTGELYFGRGESSTYNVAGGNLSLERYRALINEPDYGRGADISGNEESIRPNFGAADITCESGFYDTLFGGDAPLSQDCFDAVNATLQTRTQNEQDIIELNFQGPMFELPAGEVLGAAGYQKRRNSAEFNPDILQSTVSFTDQVVGVYPTGYLDASTSVDDYYFEALVPLLQDQPGFQRLELELGARTSDYEHTEKEDTWKGLINWRVNDALRFRGGFNRATRAPNLGELFLNSQEIFTGGGNFGDPCGIRSNAPFGAGGLVDDPVEDFPGEPAPEIAPGQTEAGAQSTLMICQQMMGGPGSQAANTFYEEANATGTSGSPFAWVLQEGNPNLTSETADTWTFGLVANMANVTLAMDWYEVDIEDAIMLYSIDYANYLCFGQTIVSTPEEAMAQAQSRACDLLPRDQVNGAPLTTSLSYDNQATIETSGMDVSVSWFRQLENLGGTLNFNMQATILDYYRTKQSPANFDPETDWAGSLGPTLSGTNGGAYDYRLFGTLGYSANNWNVSLRMRYLPSVYTAGYASQQAIIEHNERVSASGDGTLLGYTPTTEIETDSYSIFDLSFRWNATDTLSFRGGITNLLDTEPELVGRTRGYAPGTDLGSVCGDAPGCQNPTSYSLEGAGSVNAGYYDNLGRRYFLGMSVRF